MGKRYGTIYKIENKVNGKVYIGQTVNKPKYRINAHMKSLLDNSHPNNHFQKAFNKYGIDNFKSHVIEAVNIENIDDRERYWISYYKNKEGVYNLESGGNKLKTHSKITKMKLSKISRDLLSRPEIRKKLKESAKRRRGANNHNAKKIICVTTGEIFETITDAAKKYNLGVSCVSGVCRGRRKTAGILDGKPLRFAYYEEGKNYEKINIKISGRKRKVICINTGDVFDSVSEAARQYNIQQSAISRCITGKGHSAGKDEHGTPLIWDFLSNYNINKKYELSINKGPNHYRSRKVICVNTMEIFDSLTEASKKTGVHQSKISLCCNGKRRYAGRLKCGDWMVWRYLDDYNPEENFVFTRNGGNSSRKKMVRCITTGEVFDTMKLACERYGISRSTMWKMCTGKTNKGYKLNNGMIVDFEYVQ